MSSNPKPQQPLCAVVDCTTAGKPHPCPADGTSHGHGCIHHEHCHSTLVFRNDSQWHLICDEHYAVCVAARIAWEEAKREEPTEGAS